jgi:hypothetical protein
MVEFIARKRAAAYKGEVGLFPAAEVWVDEFQHVKMDQDVTVVATNRRNQKQNALSWVIADRVFNASEDFDSKETAREAILIEAGHFERAFDNRRGIAFLRSLPTHNLDGTDFLKLLRKMIDVTCTVFVPSFRDSIFRRELEDMLMSLQPAHDNRKGGDARLVAMSRSDRRKTG